MRQLTPVEAAVLLSVASCALAVAVPAFVRNVHASRLVEPMDGLQRIAGRAQALAAGRPNELGYPADAPLTPATVPRGELVVDPPGTWDHPTWRELGFSISDPHAFSFAFDESREGEVKSFVAKAHGDLDGDGSLSTFSIAGKLQRGGEPVTLPLEIHREVE